MFILKHWGKIPVDLGSFPSPPFCLPRAPSLASQACGSSFRAMSCIYATRDAARYRIHVSRDYCKKKKTQIEVTDKM